MTKRSTTRGNPASTTPRLTEEEFVKRAVVRLRKGKRRGIHVVYSNFNEAFRIYFDKDPKAAMEKLAAQGKVVVRPAKGGAVLYLPEDAPESRPEANQVLNDILR